MKYALLTYPKAGSQWVRDILFDPAILARTPGLVFRAPDMLQLRDWQARGDGACSGPLYNVRAEEWEHWSSPGDLAVIVRRDPRDILISWTFSMLFSHSAEAVHVRCFREPLALLGMRHRLMIGTITQTGILPALSWLNNRLDRRVLTTSYEALVARPAQAFSEIFEFFGWDIRPELRDDVIARHAFEVRSGGRARGDSDEQSHYRRGVAGDWKTYFDRRLGELFEASYPGALVLLGYERSNDWYASLPEHNEVLEREEAGSRESLSETAKELERLRRQLRILESSYAEQRDILQEYARLLAPA